jgi:hypothetical protein
MFSISGLAFDPKTWQSELARQFVTPTGRIKAKNTSWPAADKPKLFPVVHKDGPSVDWKPAR